MCSNHQLGRVNCTRLLLCLLGASGLVGCALGNGGSVGLRKEEEEMTTWSHAVSLVHTVQVNTVLQALFAGR